jgi:hypothetical protein
MLRTQSAIATIFSLLLASQALAQTAEEAATFVLTGIESGAKIDIGGSYAIWKRANRHPLTFIAEGFRANGRVSLTLTTQRVDECRFEIISVADVDNQAGADKLQIKADFARITGVYVDNGDLIIRGDGLCVLDKVDNECHRDVSGLVTALDDSKLKSAFDSLKQSVCRQ